MIRIIADSTCSLSEELVKKLRIKIAPHRVVLNGDEIEDDRNAIEPSDFYAKITEIEHLEAPIEPTSRKYIELFTDGVRNGDLEFIVITPSKGSGNSYNAVMKARETFLNDVPIEGIRIAVVDSGNLTAGYGYLVMKVANLRNEGASLEDLVEFAESYKSHIKSYVCVSDALSLVEMGLLKNSKRQIKKVSDNFIMLGTDSKGIGEMLDHVDGIDQVYKIYTDELINNMDAELTDSILIEYSSDISLAEGLKDYILKNGNFYGDIYITQMSLAGIFSLGRGSVGLAYAAKPEDAFLNMYGCQPF